MRGKEIITKLIIPGAIAMIICLIVHPMCMNGEILDWRKLLLFVGIPFGIQKMFLLVVPRNVGTGEMLGLVVLKLMVVLLFLLSCCFMVARLLDEEISMYGYEGKENWEREQLPDKLSRSSADERYGDK